MTTDSPDDLDTEESLAERLEQWIATQMPIIRMHGGTSSVRKADADSGEVIIELGGGCSGCEVSDVTAGNIGADLLKWAEIEEVTVRIPEGGENLGVNRAESIMGVDRTEGGRGDWGSSNPGKDNL
jgi:Fe-S cluster biogenesis protein NfuA